MSIPGSPTGAGSGTSTPTGAGTGSGTSTPVDLGAGQGGGGQLAKDLIRKLTGAAAVKPSPLVYGSAAAGQQEQAHSGASYLPPPGQTEEHVRRMREETRQRKALLYHLDRDDLFRSQRAVLKERSRLRSLGQYSERVPPNTVEALGTPLDFPNTHSPALYWFRRQGELQPNNLCVLND